MLPRPLRDALAAIVFLLCGLAGWGCAPSTLSHPAILGASASAGFGCEISGPPPESKAYLADMEAVYQAIVRGWHSDPVFLADASFYTRSRQSVVEQMDAALAQNPSIIIAIDYLFWSVYASRDASMTTEAVDRDRHEALEQALGQLDRFEGPVIVGDLPDMRAAIGRMLSERNVPPPSQLHAFNSRIDAWAEQRRAKWPVVVLPIAALARAVGSGDSVPTSFDVFPPEAAATLLQPDRLHPTTTGLVVMLREGLAGLAAQNAIGKDDFRTDLSDIVARLPAEAAAAENRREPGLWTLLSVKGKMSEFGTAIEKKDCARANQLFDEVMEKVARLKKTPHELAGVYVGFTLSSYRYHCKDSPEAVRRWRDRLAPAIERPLPDPWPLELWHEFNQFLDEEHRTVERGLRLKQANPSLSDEYNDTLRSAALSACYTDPTAYLTLLPSWQHELNRMAASAKETAEFWTKLSQSPAWPKEVERRYQTALAWAFNEEDRQKVIARRESFNDPRPVIISGRAMTIDRIVTLERALRITGNPEAAQTVHDRLAELALPDEAMPAYDRVEKEAAQALGLKKKP